MEFTRIAEAALVNFAAAVESYVDALIMTEAVLLNGGTEPSRRASEAGYRLYRRLRLAEM